MIFRKAVIIVILTASYINMLLLNSYAKHAEDSRETG